MERHRANTTLKVISCQMRRNGSMRSLLAKELARKRVGFLLPLALKLTIGHIMKKVKIIYKRSLKRSERKKRELEEEKKANKQLDIEHLEKIKIYNP